MGSRAEQIARRLIARWIEPWKELPLQWIHGDCHFGNMLWSQDQVCFLDFDDARKGPVVQDFFLLLKGRDEESLKLRESLIEGYSEFSHFPIEQLKMIEPLRALRILHFSAWIARRWQDPSFPKMFPLFGTDSWWQSEVDALSEIEAL